MATCPIDSDPIPTLKEKIQTILHKYSTNYLLQAHTIITWGAYVEQYPWLISSLTPSTQILALIKEKDLLGNFPEGKGLWIHLINPYSQVGDYPGKRHYPLCLHSSSRSFGGRGARTE